MTAILTATSTTNQPIAPNSRTHQAHDRHVPPSTTRNRAPTYPRVLDELLPASCHVAEQYTNNPIEADHGRLKSRVRPMRGLKRLRSARVISAGHAFIQNLRRGHYEFSMDVDTRPTQHRLRGVPQRLRYILR